jgi:hypothetical protein
VRFVVRDENVALMPGIVAQVWEFSGKRRGAKCNYLGSLQVLISAAGFRSLTHAANRAKLEFTIGEVKLPIA